MWTDLRRFRSHPAGGTYLGPGCRTGPLWLGGRGGRRGHERRKRRKHGQPETSPHPFAFSLQPSAFSPLQHRPNQPQPPRASSPALSTLQSLPPRRPPQVPGHWQRGRHVQRSPLERTSVVRQPVRFSESLPASCPLSPKPPPEPFLPNSPGRCPNPACQPSRRRKDRRQRDSPAGTDCPQLARTISRSGVPTKPSLLRSPGMAGMAKNS